MNAGYECCDRMPFRGRDVAKIDRFKQGDIALLSILSRLQASGADAVQAGSRFDTSENIDDITCLCTHRSAFFSSMIFASQLVHQRGIGRSALCPTQRRSNLFRDQLDRPQNEWMRGIDRM